MNKSIVQWVLPLFLLLVLAVIAIFSPADNIASEWFPLTGAWVNSALLENTLLSALLALLFMAAVATALYCIVFKTNTIPIGFSMLLFLMLIMDNIYSFRFGVVYLAMLCIAWMQFALLSQQIYTGFMLLSLGSLFYAPLVWLFPFALVPILQYGISDFARTALKSLAGFVTPYIYLLTFRWIAYDDVSVYIQHFAAEITDITLSFHLLHLTDYFLIAVQLYLLARAAIFIYSRLPNGMPLYILKTEMVSVVLFAAFVLCFYNTSEIPLMNFLALPVSIILAYYYKNSKKRAEVTAEFLLLMAAVLINSLSNIIN